MLRRRGSCWTIRRGAGRGPPPIARLIQLRFDRQDKSPSSVWPLQWARPTNAGRAFVNCARAMPVAAMRHQSLAHGTRHPSPGAVGPAPAAVRRRHYVGAPAAALLTGLGAGEWSSLRSRPYALFRCRADPKLRRCPSVSQSIALHALERSRTNIRRRCACATARMSGSGTPCRCSLIQAFRGLWVGSLSGALDMRRAPILPKPFVHPRARIRPDRRQADEYLRPERL
jgi:hypothetical protein